jgi:cell division protein CrgA
VARHGGRSSYDCAATGTFISVVWYGLRRRGKDRIPMPKSRSKRRLTQEATPPKPKPSANWVAPVFVSLLAFGLVYLLLFYAHLLPWGDQDGLGNYNLLIGFVPLIVGLLLATRWR